MIVSDFCGQWDEHISTLRLLDIHGNNVQPVLIALDEWHGFTASMYGARLYDPVTRRTTILNMRKHGDIARYAHRAEQHMADVAQCARPLGIPFISISLMADAITTVYKAFLKMGRA
jgi:hypothetical protein